MKLRNTTKMAIQAAIAIAIAELISEHFAFERGYWITLTAMALTAQTWGESVKRSVERVGMTALGGCVGTVLYFLLPGDKTIIMIFLLIFVFFTIYLMKIQHLIAMFFLTCFVVFLFALIGNWNLLLLQARIIDTALGAGIALTVGCFLFPVKTNVADLFIGYLQKMNALLKMVIKTKQARTYVSSHVLSMDFQDIKKNALSIRYELLFHRLSGQDFFTVLNRIEQCSLYMSNLIESYQWLLPHLNQDDIRLIETAANTTKHNIKVLILQLQKEGNSTMLPAANVSSLLAKAITKHPERFASLESDTHGFYSLMYFFTQLNENLNEVSVVLAQKY
ncbi:FUSC family protein [Legionella oakridgensis]|uniref:Fusaric acid resistance protein family protein n=2 Tax=Legionella oakridgensis TaxID=29423 RepID=A0A0W0X4W9_9GAMM|nr:FUSC family protein [Legionella oakridgensis]AHE68168.1 putative membrane protein [Legionella oakridgensis ATCC 33761 = DSM 21215]ETO92257.1 putative membrane protein [Legionella oakridgensis RV-2-2007]KTD39631.1 Fusaric acid resistance protein family protein [Legionella oakridgensis]STY21133.1 Predicted membrane protein [Legionella longbeachae]